MKIFLLFVLSVGWAAPAFAAVEKVNLKDAIDRALKNNGEIKSQRAQEHQAMEEIRRVDGEFGPRVEGLLGIGPITKAEGNALYTVEDKSVLGRAIIGKISLTQPLYTWGRKANYRNAAMAGVHVKEAETELKEGEVRFQVKEAYYGYQLSNSLLDFISSGKADLQKSLDQRAGKKNEKEDFRMQIFLREVDSREAEVVKYLELAKEGFALRLGMPRGSVLPADEWILPDSRQKKSVDEYVSLALAQRPEFRQLAEGIFAKKSLAKAEKKAMLPVFALMAAHEFADTNVRTTQPGVFSYDPYNRETWALGVGFKLDLQWTLQSAKAAKMRAEAEELEFKEVYARQGIETEVRKAYLELVEAETRLQAATEAYKTAKKWLTGQAMNYGSGLGNSQGLIEAYGARAETTKNYFEAVYRHHLAWATLSKAVGAEVDPVLLKP